MLTTLLYSLLALDQTVATLATQYGPWLYAILFVVIFAETGLVVCPFLPGDSILFIAGAVVAVANLNVHVLAAVLVVAAVLGDSVNYAVGHYIGPKVFHRPDSRWFRQEYLRRTQAFYDRYGGVTIIIGRFVPIIRTFAPFLAGVAGMPSASSMIDFSGSGLPPRICSSAVMTATAPTSTIRSCSDFAEKPPKTTECVAPIRAQACIATIPSIDIGMHGTTRSPAAVNCTAS